MSIVLSTISEIGAKKIISGAVSVMVFETVSPLIRDAIVNLSTFMFSQFNKEETNTSFNEFNQKSRQLNVDSKEPTLQPSLVPTSLPSFNPTFSPTISGSTAYFFKIFNDLVDAGIQRKDKLVFEEVNNSWYIKGMSDFGPIPLAPINMYAAAKDIRKKLLFDQNGYRQEVRVFKQSSKWDNSENIHRKQKFCLSDVLKLKGNTFTLVCENTNNGKQSPTLWRFCREKDLNKVKSKIVYVWEGDHIYFSGDFIKLNNPHQLFEFTTYSKYKYKQCTGHWIGVGVAFCVFSWCIINLPCFDSNSENGSHLDSRRQRLTRDRLTRERLASQQQSRLLTDLFDRIKSKKANGEGLTTSEINSIYQHLSTFKKMDRSLFLSSSFKQMTSLDELSNNSLMLVSFQNQIDSLNCMNNIINSLHLSPSSLFDLKPTFFQKYRQLGTAIAQFNKETFLSSFEGDEKCEFDEFSSYILNFFNRLKTTLIDEDLNTAFPIESKLKELYVHIKQIKNTVHDGSACDDAESELEKRMLTYEKRYLSRLIDILDESYSIHKTFLREGEYEESKINDLCNSHIELTSFTNYKSYRDNLLKEKREYFNYFFKYNTSGFNIKDLQNTILKKIDSFEIKKESLELKILKQVPQIELTLLGDQVLSFNELINKKIKGLTNIDLSDVIDEGTNFLFSVYGSQVGENGSNIPEFIFLFQEKDSASNVNIEKLKDLFDWINMDELDKSDFEIIHSTYQEVIDAIEFYKVNLNGMLDKVENSALSENGILGYLPFNLQSIFHLFDDDSFYSEFINESQLLFIRNLCLEMSCGIDLYNEKQKSQADLEAPPVENIESLKKYYHYFLKIINISLRNTKRKKSRHADSVKFKVDNNPNENKDAAVKDNINRLCQVLMENSDVFNYQAIVKDTLAKNSLEWALNLAYIAGQLSKVGVLGYHYGERNQANLLFYMISKICLDYIQEKMDSLSPPPEYRFIAEALHRMHLGECIALITGRLLVEFGQDKGCSLTISGFSLKEQLNVTHLTRL